MNAKPSIYNALLVTIVATVQPCWAQLIDPATQTKAPSSSQPPPRAFDMRNTGMSPEIIRPGAIDARRAEIRHLSPTVIEQIGKVKQSMPSHVGVP